jgi:hypothetical protein
MIWISFVESGQRFSLAQRERAGVREKLKQISAAQKSLL